MKRVISLIAVILITASFFGGCNAGVISYEPETQSTAQYITQGEQITSVTKGEKVTADKKEEETSAAKKEETTKEKEKTTEKKEDKQKDKKDGASSKKKKKNKNKKQDKEESEEDTTEEDDGSLTCTLTIECTDIYDHLDIFSGEKSALPKDGYILHTCKCTFEEGETVYGLLTRVAKEKGITLNVRDTGLGKYVAGINGINEKMAGKTSGWTYYVNGSFPLKSISKYNIKKGDEVLFHYSCVYKGN